MTPEVLQLARSGQEEEAQETLMNGLLGKDANGKCSNISECVSGGCQVRNPEPSGVQNTLAQAAGD